MLKSDTTINYLSRMISSLYKTKGMEGILELICTKCDRLKNEDITIEKAKVELEKFVDILFESCFRKLLFKKYLFFEKIHNFDSKDKLLDNFSNDFVNFVSDSDSDSEIILNIKKLFKEVTLDDLKNINVNYISDKFNINRSYLSNLFIIKERINLSEFILQKKINFAFKILSSYNSDLSPTEISRKIGFSNYSHFKKAFERFFIISPTKVFKNSKISNKS